ncbi:hypothetical protein K505DRAFT_110739 [Melanomma pulvis-pyrius CBS 109.77]|uniref:Uncharacterized protein n=1 Tax=Melanomma pulvis-pyrius CBS 109.77 TaxID=1314802 RepID=A0A6A6XP43_9PLEO|nr:hypothetical protein K505DRAFT_110739 [Melanomma pulvis-pyrius CBS 109.77]
MHNPPSRAPAYSLFQSFPEISSLEFKRGIIKGPIHPPSLPRNSTEMQPKSHSVRSTRSMNGDSIRLHALRAPSSSAVIFRCGISVPESTVPHLAPCTPNILFAPCSRLRTRRYFRIPIVLQMVGRLIRPRCVTLSNKHAMLMPLYASACSE